MRKKIFNKKYKIKKINLYFLVILFLIFSIYTMVYNLGRKLSPIVIDMAEFEINRISTFIANKAITQVLENKIDIDDIFRTVKSSDGKIQTIDFNPSIVNKLLNNTATVVQENLRKFEEGDLDDIGISNMNFGQNKIEQLKKGIIAEIPLGVIFKNSLLSNIGPFIPIKLHYLGDVNTNIKTSIKTYGINNALLEVGIKLELTTQVFFPLTSKKITFQCYIPIAIKVIEGIVPNYYSNGLESNSSLYSIPF